MTFEEAQKAYPMEFSARFKNKLVARYPGPGGESYAVLCLRFTQGAFLTKRNQTGCH